MQLPIYAYVALLLLAGLLSTRVMKYLKLPNVTGYIVTGILMGPFVFGLLFNSFDFASAKNSYIYEYISKLTWVSNVALGFIAFSIGTSFKMSTIKAVGKKVVIITIFESFGASLLVILALLIAHYVAPEKISISLALTLGAIAAATAPAATLMIIKQYKAKGEMVDTLLPVVALDDASALILFSILFQIASSLSTGGDFDVYKMVGKPIIEIIISIGIGAILGLIISFLNKLFNSRNNKLILCIITVFVSLGIYYLFKDKVFVEQTGGFELSSLLMCMMAATIYTNLAKNSNQTFDLLDRFTSPIFMMFFVLSGANLDLSIFGRKEGVTIIIVAAIYIVARVIGKWSGAAFGAKVSKCSKEVTSYLGFALIPQAGVAIGLATNASSLFKGNPELEYTGSLILAVILTTTLVYELVGPLVAKWALTKANCISLN